jgi:hypoxanthine-DNA glycosylase
MAFVSSFPPISGPDARILILGSMPGVASLSAQQYYAHPRNLFWPVIQALLGATGPLSYPEKRVLPIRHRIALWDVLECCVRPGSLDSAITEEKANDFGGFFKAHPHISHVYFNGRKAEGAFRKWVKTDRNLVFTTLPSTSPANASYDFERTLHAWRQIALPTP